MLQVISCGRELSAICRAATSSADSASSTASPAPAAADADKANSTSTTVAPAIIAIEIVDPNANQTVANRNTKRTIEANLGYGQQQQPKLEYYKYSQEDIPAYNGGAATEIFGATTPEGGAQQQQQQQQQFPQAPGLQQLYQPGTMLFSQLNSQGQLSQLTPGPPLNTNIQQPVIVVRVRPEQLASLTSGLFPNLPQSHPFAPNLNNVDLSSLLTGYAQNTLQGQGGGLHLPQAQAFDLPQGQPFALPGLPQQINQFQGFPAGGLPGYDLSGVQQVAAQGGYDLSGAQHLAPGVANFDLGGAQQLLAAQGPQLFQQAAAFPQQGGYQQQGAFQFPAAPLVFPQAPGAHQAQPLLQQQPQQQVQQQPLQTFENYPDNAHTRVVFKGPAQPAAGPTPSVSNSPAPKSSSDDEGESHQPEFSFTTSDSDAYHYDKPVKDSKKFYASDADDDYKSSYTNPGGASGYDVNAYQPGSYSDYDGEQSQQKNEREPYSYSYSTRSSSSSSSPNERTKKSSNSKPGGSSSSSSSSSSSGSSSSSSNNSGIRMRVPKSLRKSRGALRDKREKMDD